MRPLHGGATLFYRVKSMEDRVKYIFDVLENTHISYVDFSRLTGISRQTIYRWQRGGNIKDQFRFKFATRMAMKLEELLKEGKLPLQDRLKKDQRIAVLRRLIHPSK